MTQKTKSLSLIIPTYYRHEHLENIFELLSKQTVSPNEIIIVDQTPVEDRPYDFYENYKQEMETLNVYFLEQPSAPAARNLGAEKANSEILLIIDDDILFEDDFIQAHLEVMESEHVDIVNGGTTMQDDLPDHYPWDIVDMDPVRFFLGAPNHKWEGMMLSVSSCNFSIKRKIYLESGGFDVFAPRMQDFEFGFRLYRNGAKIFYSYKPKARHIRGGGGLRKEEQQ